MQVGKEIYPWKTWEWVMDWMKMCPIYVWWDQICSHEILICQFIENENREAEQCCYKLKRYFLPDMLTEPIHYIGFCNCIK